MQENSLQMKIEFSAENRSSVKTEFGNTAFIDTGSGFPTVFLHGLGQNAYFWRHQLMKFRDQRRCIAVDLLAHGHTEAKPGADVSFREQAKMIFAVLDKLQIEQVDLVMNDSGGAIGQLMAVSTPGRIRSMAFSNCDVHDNWPPQTLNEIRDAARAGVYADQIGEFLSNPKLFAETTGPLVYEDPNFAQPDAIRASVGPIISSDERKAAFNRYVGMQDTSQLVDIEAGLRQLQIPSLIVWGTDDPFFPLKWAYWLQDALPLAEDVIEIEGAKLFFPEERANEFNVALEEFWTRFE